MRRIVIPAVLGTAFLVGVASAQYPPYPAPYGNPDQGATQLVSSWYQRFLGRQPDQWSSTWIDQIRNGQSPDAVLASILSSQEYYNRGGGTPQGFIQRLFLDLTGQPPTPGQMNHWTNRLFSSDRTDVAHALLLRYPQAWQGGAPASYYPPTPSYAPPTNYYNYRRPHYPYRR